MTKIEGVENSDQALNGINNNACSVAIFSKNCWMKLSSNDVVIYQVLRL